MPNEWNITGQAATWLTEICTARPELGFKNATVEETVKGKNTRHDIVLFDQNDKAVLCGEAKRPENPEGRNPMADALLFDAFIKASTSGIPYFFTWNVNRCVLFDSLKNAPLTERSLEHFYVLGTPIKSSKELEGGKREAEIKKFFGTLLERLSAILRGEDTLGTLPLDELFLLKWEAALEQPVAQTYAALVQKYGESPFTGNLNAWMRDKQGMTLSDDVDARNDNLERAAKLACYVLANRILFYKALRRNPSFKRLRKFQIPADISTGAGFKNLITEFFKNARSITKDYETIFGGDEFGDVLPFVSDAAVDAWRDLSAGTDDFDFTQLGFEIIGQIFERLLSTEERHKFGQHYTRSEVVDLINAFCIREADATVFDPACGGGTFLVRAYARKKLLAAGTLSHQDLLPQLIGNDISAYPAHLTTINLATRDLIEKANYPFVLRGDFFDLAPHQAAFKLPLSGNLDILETQEIPDIDAFVGNPPYIRQEKLGEYYGPKYKAELLKMTQRVAPDALFSARSDIHCYFFPHAMEFLKPSGWMGFLVSSSWLDTGYGFRLQKFLLDHFRVVALIESAVEPWFTGARVTTVAVILQREGDAQKRAENTVRFVWAKKMLGELIPNSSDETERQSAFEALRGEIESAQNDDEFEMPLPQGGTCKVGQTALHGWRVRSVNQGDLEQLGLTGIAGADEEESEDAKSSAAQAAGELGAGEYSGSKWGLFLRAPDIFFGLLKAGKGRFAPLGTLADVKFGVKSGCDAFFFPRDVTDEVMKTMSPDEMMARYDLAPADTKKLRLVESGDGTRHIIEAEYLKPVVFNSKDVKTPLVDTSGLLSRIFAVEKTVDELKGTHALKYVEWGQSEGFHDRSTCKSRSLWYSLSVPEPGQVLWTMTQRYKYNAPENPHGAICNKRLFNISVKADFEPELLAPLLNSTIVSLFRFCFGRLQGGDPVMEMEVSDTKMMLVPDPRGASESAKARLSTAFDKMKTRVVGHLVSVDGVGDELSGELAHTDRQDLDDATLELLGVSDAASRLSLRKALYAEITQLYREIRRAEVSMQGHRSKNNRKSAPTAITLAGEIWNSLAAPPIWKVPADFLEADEATELFSIEPGRAKIKQASLLEGAGVEINKIFHETGDMKRAQYLEAHAHAQIWGEIEVPTTPAACEIALNKWFSLFDENQVLFESEARARTVDEKLQARIVAELWKRTRVQ